MTIHHSALRFLPIGISLGVCPMATAQEKVHFTYLWHLEQPIYWPDKQLGQDRYERLAESLARGGVHPQNNLNEIFGAADRVAVYQGRVRDSVSAWAAFPPGSSTPEGGVQLSSSGGLIENIQSVAGTGWIGGQYGANWHSGLRQARGWATFNGSAFPRVDIVQFSFHHALMPLLDPSAMRKEIQAYKAIYADAWGAAPGLSQGFFPSEMAFSERMIPILAAEGIQWAIVSGEKLSRACADFPVVFGSGGINCDPPNKADQLNPAQGGTNYYRLSIDRGCAPAEAYPFAFTPHRARYVDPDSGVISSIIVVPASQSLGWKDGYSAQGIGDFDALQTRNDPARPMLVVLAHDGDNAWGGGFTYYMEATPTRVSQAKGAGYVPTVVQRYLADHPVPANDIVKVEDGAWVNADGDFGAPQMINWNWPLLSAGGQIDVENGWHEDARNWAVITAAQNRVDAAEAIHLAGGGSVDPRKIVYPETGANAVERAWHYFLGALNSGYMYYGTSLDMEVKPTLGCNNAARLADPVIAAAGPAGDITPPTVWAVQRHPWNPGSVNFGPQFGYQQVVNNGDFYVWSFVYDASGLTTVTLKYRTHDTIPALLDDSNKTYAGGPVWTSIAMTRRSFPAGNVYNNPTSDFFVMPTHIAEQAWVKLAGIRSKLVDYYIEAVDSRGNIRRSPIQHVWVGDGTGGSDPGGGTVVTTQPSPPIAGQSVTILYDPTGRNLAGAGQVYIHRGINNWTNIPSPDPAMTRPGGTGPWQHTFTVPAGATQIDCVFNNGSGTWDNNNGADWHITVSPGAPVSGQCCVGGACTFVSSTQCSGAFTAGGSCTPNPCPFVMDGALDGGTAQVASNGSMFLNASLRADTLYIAAPNSPAGNDRFIYLAPIAGPGTLTAANWAKAGQVAAWSSFLSAEADNAYVGWQDQTSGAATASAKSGVLEGTINLRQEFGLSAGASLPASIWLASAQFGTGNGAPLVASLQVPTSADGDTTLNASEYIEVPLCSLTDPPTCCPADFNHSGGQPTVQDLFDFLAAWFALDPSADFNNSGAVTVQDLFSFLAAWFAGC